jgi:hypothetical protein
MYLVAKWSFMIVTMGGIILFVGGIIVYILYNGISLLMFTLDFSHVTKVILWTITIIVIVGTLLFCLSKLSRGGGGYGDDPNY